MKMLLFIFVILRVKKRKKNPIIIVLSIQFQEKDRKRQGAFFVTHKHYYLCTYNNKEYFLFKHYLVYNNLSSIYVY